MICITNEHLPGVRPCVEYGEHRVTCPDHPGWANPPGDCYGCLPREAERGYVCGACFETLTQVYADWDRFVRLVNAAGMRAMTPETGGGSAATGYTTLPLTYLALDECARYLATFTGLLHEWVATKEGARDAVQFSRAAAAAYRALEVEEREKQWQRVRCPGCGELSLVQNPTREVGGQVIVSCRSCGHVLNKVRRPVDRWAGSRPCAHDEHLDCGGAQCRCACHQLGRTSTAQGIAVLFDADQHTLGFAHRDAWAITTDLKITRVGGERERTAA